MLPANAKKLQNLGGETYCASSLIQKQRMHTQGGTQSPQYDKQLYSSLQCKVYRPVVLLLDMKSGQTKVIPIRGLDFGYIYD